MDTAFVTVWHIAGIIAGCVVTLVLLAVLIILFRFIWDVLLDL